MTFGGEVKNELCRAGLSRKCCAQAEAYGVLLYCNTFCGGEIRIVTEHEAFAQRLPALFRKAFRLSFDRLPEGEGQAGVFHPGAGQAAAHPPDLWGGPGGPGAAH